MYVVTNDITESLVLDFEKCVKIVHSTDNRSFHFLDQSFAETKPLNFGLSWS